MVWKHEYSVWEKYYPRGSPILDVGAEQESVEFFERRGQKVIPIGDYYGTHVNAIKIDIDRGEYGMVLETHGACKWTLLYRFPGTQTCLWRLDPAFDFTPHGLKIGMAHNIRMAIDLLVGEKQDV